MKGPRSILIFATAVALILAAGDCLQAGSLSERSAECCTSMPCAPSDQHHDCCKRMVPSMSAGFLPTAKASIGIPLVVVADIPVLWVSLLPPHPASKTFEALGHARPVSLDVVSLPLLI